MKNTATPQITVPQGLLPAQKLVSNLYWPRAHHFAMRSDHPWA